LTHKYWGQNQENFMANIKISVINQTTCVTDVQAQPVVAAMQVQVHRDFAPAWGIDADLTFVPKGQTPDSMHWWLVLLDDSDTAGALGYHELTPAGLPIGKVFCKTDLKYGLEWSVTASHELLEMLGDPEINLTVFLQTTNTTGYLYAFENCDAVEDDKFGYQIDNVLMSDFVLPAYFQRSMPGNKWDFGGHLQGPYPTMLPGGYLSQFPVNIPNAQQGWSQIQAQRMITEAHGPDRTGRTNPGARKLKRAVDRSTWKTSTVTTF
jgi:hypothetical protein